MEMEQLQQVATSAPAHVAEGPDAKQVERLLTN
jgi:hypothetical protein